MTVLCHFLCQQGHYFSVWVCPLNFSGLELKWQVDYGHSPGPLGWPILLPLLLVDVYLYGGRWDSLYHCYNHCDLVPIHLCWKQSYLKGPWSTLRDTSDLHRVALYVLAHVVEQTLLLSVYLLNLVYLFGCKAVLCTFRLTLFGLLDNIAILYLSFGLQALACLGFLGYYATTNQHPNLGNLVQYQVK